MEGAAQPRGIPRGAAQVSAEVVGWGRDPEPLPPLHRLKYMGLDAELDPRRRVTAWVEGGSLNFLEDGVVLACVPTEVWLHRNQHWRQQSPLPEHQGLDDKRQPPAAVSEPEH